MADEIKLAKICNFCERGGAREWAEISVRAEMETSALCSDVVSLRDELNLSALPTPQKS